MKTSAKTLLGLLRNINLAAQSEVLDYQAAGYALGVSAAANATPKEKKPKKAAAET